MNRSTLFLIALVFAAVSLQGCSLLFITKSKTGMMAVKAEEVPKAKSLSRQMKKPYVLKHKVEEDETLEFLGGAFYGNAKRGARRIARDNGLKVEEPLKVGKVLHVVEPTIVRTLPELHDMERDAKDPNAKKKEEKPIDDLMKGVVAVERPKENKAFAAGEKLTYEVTALSVVAGTASLEVGDPVTVAHRPCYPLTAKAKAAFPFSTIYPVHDVQTSYFDVVDHLSWKFENDVSEGDYKAQNTELYDQVHRQLWRQHNHEDPELVDIPPFTQDLISCFYYYRLLPLEVGKKYSIPTSSSGRNYNLVIEVMKREKVTIPMGTYDCFLVKPYVQHDTVFRNEEDIDLWLTTDPRHVPVLVKSGIVIGSINITLMQAILPQIPGVPDTLATP